MKMLSTITIAAVLVLTACGTRTDSQVATTTEMGTPGERVGPAEGEQPLLSWEAAITPSPDFELVGEAGIRDLPEDQTRIAVEIRGAASNSMLPWHVHEGTCGSGGAIVGDPTAYAPLSAGLNGEATADATIDVTLDTEADYHINVHKSPSETETIVACGELHPN